MNTFQEGNWKFQCIGQNFYKVYYNAAGVTYIAQTASDVSKDLTVPFFHRWVRASFYHTDSSNVESTGYWTVTLIRNTSTTAPTLFQEYLYGDEKMHSPRITEKFGEGFEYEGGTYRLTLNAGNTTRSVPQFIIQKLDG